MFIGGETGDSLAGNGQAQNLSTNVIDYNDAGHNLWKFHFILQSVVIQQNIMVREYYNVLSQ
jgi:hypothetical protein